jgi:hypothetical protein
MSREYAPTELKRRLRPALEELERSGFLEKLNDNERYLNVEKGRWRILFVRGPKRRAEEDEAKAHNTREALFSELTSRGVHHLVGKDLLERYEADHIRAKLEVFDWFMSHEQENVIRNPAGYLVASIRDDYAMPDEFMPKLKRVKKTKKTAAKAGRQTGEGEAEPTQNEPQTASVADKSQGALKHQEEEDRRLEMQWQAMPAEIRHQITESVNNKHTGLLRWPAMMMPMYLEEMQRMYGESPPVEKIDAGMAVSLTEKILNEEDAEKNQK